MIKKWYKKYPVLLPLTIAFIVFVVHLGLIQTNIMEARNLITAREMAEDGNWIFTTLNGQPRYEKPPLPTWLTAITGKAAGFENLFFLRLPSVIIALIMIFFFFNLIKNVGISEKQSTYASVILGTSFYIFFSARDNQWDIYCHSFMIICIYFLHKGILIKKNYPFILSGLFFGFSVLCKGPVSPYVLFLPFIMAYLVSFNDGLKQWKKIIFTIAFGLLVGLTWPLTVRFLDAPHVIAATKQEAVRWVGYNTRPFYYYWSFFVQSGIWTTVAFTALLYPYLKRRVTDLKRYKFSLMWTLFSVLLLSVVPEKKSRYLLPVLIPLAMTMSFYIEYLIREYKNIHNRWEFIWTCFVFGTIGLASFILPIALIITAWDNFSDYSFWLCTGLLACWICGVLLFYGIIKRIFNFTFWSTAALMCAVMIFLLPVSKVFYNNPGYFGGEGIRNLESRHGIKTYQLKGSAPEIVWEYGGKIPDIFDANKINFPLESEFGLIMNEADTILLGAYKLKKLARIDVNHVDPKSKSYNMRLVRDYYSIGRP